MTRHGRQAAHWGGVAALASLLSASPAGAAPQANVGLTVGAEAEDVVGPESFRGVLHFGGRASVLFLRNRGADMAIGPYVDAATAGFKQLDLGGGAEWLIPIRDDLPLVVSTGLFARNGDSRTWASGVENALFFGSRSYNFHSCYGLAAGLFAQARWLPSTPSTVDIVFGVQIDGELLALPWVFLFEALAH